MIQDDVVRGQLSGALVNAVDAACRSELAGGAQEHVITTSILRSLEHKINGINIDGFAVEIIATDLTDKGRGSLEKKIGADMYISFGVSYDGWKSKGILVQSKKLKSEEASIDYSKLRGQASDMLTHTKSAFVFGYTSNGVKYLPADYFYNPDSKNIDSSRGKSRFSGRPLYGLFDNILKCAEGDIGIGLPEDFFAPSDYGDDYFMMRKRILGEKAKSLAASRALYVGLKA